MSFKEKARKAGKGIVKHATDCTALLVSSNPIYSIMETMISGMSNAVSIKSRLTVAAMTYLGMGSIFSLGRDVSNRVFHIDGNSSELKRGAHDALYTAAFNLAITPPIYLSQGADIKQAIVGGVTAAVAGPVLGPILGYAVDIGRDLTGLGNCDRALYPDCVKRQSSTIKKGLAALLTAGSIGAMAGVYFLNSYLHSDKSADNSEKISIVETSEGNR